MQITLKQIQEFSEKYNKDKSNKQIEKRITKLGLEKACINEQIIKENPPIFNIELCDTKRYDQEDSLKCWIFAGINVIKRNIAENLNIDAMNLELSDNYIAFFDKLEKSNDIYEKVIHANTNDLQQIKKSKILNLCVVEYGNWTMFLAILNKYGIVPLEAMKNTVESQRYEKLWNLYREKVKADVVSLLEYKKKGKDNNELEKIKYKFLQENYAFLSKILGEPPIEFDYKYTNIKQEKVHLSKITPLEFKKYVTLNLQDHIAVENEFYWNREYNRKYRYREYTNIYRKTDTEVLNITSNELKKLAIKQLKDGVPVYIGLCIKKYRNIEKGILDTRIYNYEKDLGLKRLNKENAMKLDETHIQIL